MTQYINTITGQVVTEAQIRAEYPNTSFANIFTPPDNYQVVFPAPAPAHDPLTQSVREIAPVLTSKGHYEQAWEVVNLEPEQVAANIAQAKQQLIQSVTAATQQRLDDFAKTRNYDGILSACTYATSPTPKFQAEGQYCVEARDNTWATLYQIMREVEVGTRPMPSSYADIENELPSLTWPI